MTTRIKPWGVAMAGRLDELEIESEALRGNRLGDPSTRPLWVYVPPGYEDDPNRRYPCVFVIQGLTGQLDMWGNREAFRPNFPELADALFASGDTLTLQDAQGDTEFFGKVTLPGTRGVDTGITRDDLQRALNQANGNRDEAAKLLGVSRATFFRKLKQFQVGQKRPRLVRPPHSA